MKKGVLIGFKNLVYAKLNSDGTYQTPKLIAGAIEGTVTPNTSMVTLYNDDQADEVATSLSDIDVELSIADIPNDVYADLLGKTTDMNGIVIDNANDVAPYVALGWCSRKSNGQYRYFWLYKGQFMNSEETYKTKGEEVEFNTPTITAKFLPLTNGQWRVKVDSDDASVPGSVISNWFTSVYISTNDTTPPTATVTPANNATSVATTSKVVFTFSKVLALSSMDKSNFILQRADGSAQQAFTVGVDNSGKVVTLTPTTTLTAATKYMAIANVTIKDQSGNALANPVVTSFTTA